MTYDGKDVSSTATKRKKPKHWIKTLMWGQRRQPAEMKVQHLHHCAIMYSKWLHKCFFLSLKEKQTTYLLLRHRLKLACAIHSGCPCKIPKGGKRGSNVWGHKKIAVTMLPLCRFKDRCYIKTASCATSGKGFEEDSSALCSVSLFSLFYLGGGLFFLHVCRLVIGVDWQCPGPITWQSDSVKTP